jgi:ADP-ribose pyrophosphatase
LKILQNQTLYKTPWFSLVSKRVDLLSSEYYVLSLSDYVTVLALTHLNQVVCVKQYRPAVECDTLELPSGHIDEGESPEEAARREFFEETGFTINSLELLGVLNPNTGRQDNKLWCFYTKDISLKRTLGHQVVEENIDVQLCSLHDFTSLIEQGEFNHSLDLSVVMMSVIKKKLELKHEK